MRIHHTRLHNAFANRSRHTEVKDENGNKVEKRRKQDGLARLQNTGRNYGGNGVRRVMKAIHEIK